MIFAQFYLHSADGRRRLLILAGLRALPEVDDVAWAAILREVSHFPISFLQAQSVP